MTHAKPMHHPRSMKLPTQYRSATIERDAIIDETRTVALSFSSDAPIDRWWGTEILDHSPGSVRLDRLLRGGALLVDHDTKDQIGVIQEAFVGQDRKGHATVRFGRSGRAEEIYRDVIDGIRSNVSVGYQIHAMKLEGKEKEKEIYRVLDWEPLEISIVSVPADVSVGVGRTAEHATEVRILSDKEEPPMEHKETAQPTTSSETVIPEAAAVRAQEAPKVDVEIVRSEAIKKEQTRVREIMAIGERFGIQKDAMAAIEKGTSLDDFRKEVLAKISNAKPVSLPELSAKEERQYSIRRAIASLAFDDPSLAPFEREVSAAIAKAYNKQTTGILVPTNLRAPAPLTTATNTDEKAGYLVDTVLMPLIELLRNRMLVRQMGAQVLSVKNPISFPRQTGPSVLYWTGEAPASDVTASYATFEQLLLTPKSAMATTAYTKQLLLESSTDVETFIRNDLVAINALGLDLAAIAGTGDNNQPKGILATDGIGSVAGGTNGAAPTWAHIVGLETEVAIDNADFGTLGYLTNAKVRGVLKQTLKASNVAGFIWEPGQNGFGEMNGYRAGCSNQVPSNLTKNASVGVCSAIIFGNWADLMIAEFGVLDITVDPYSLKKKGLVEVTTLLMADIGVRHPQSFAAMLDALTA